MALLAAMVLAPDRQGQRAGCQVVRPARDKVDSYLARMDFYNLCQLPADYPWPRFDATGRFREVVEVASEAEANAVVADLWAILQPNWTWTRPWAMPSAMPWPRS
jgi:hypothetical protein